MLYLFLKSANPKMVYQKIIIVLPQSMTNRDQKAFKRNQKSFMH